MSGGSFPEWCAAASIAAIGIFDGVLTDSEHNQIGKYLGDKYGLDFSLSINAYDDNAYPSNSGLFTTGGDPYYKASAFSRKIYQTTATRAYVKIYSTSYNIYPTLSNIGVRVDGANHIVVNAGALGTSTHTV